MHTIDGYSTGHSQGQVYIHVQLGRLGLLVKKYFCYIFVTVPVRFHWNYTVTDMPVGLTSNSIHCHYSSNN